MCEWDFHMVPPETRKHETLVTFYINSRNKI